MSVVNALAGVRVLVVEDQALVAMMLEDMLTELGCVVVGPAASVTKALELVATAGSDLHAAVLDINVRNEAVFPVADRLLALGVPFAFVSGGGIGADSAYAGTRMLQKPFRVQDLERTIASLLAG